MTDLLPLSNSASPGGGFLAHALGAVSELVPAGRRLLFVPSPRPGRLASRWRPAAT
jgi:hypothetical protein